MSWICLFFVVLCFLFIPSITFIITDFLLSTSGGLSMVPKGFAGAVYFTTSALTASNTLTFFLITLLIFCFLFLGKLLNLITLLKVVALGPMNLAVRPITFTGFLGSRGLTAVSARGSFHAGASTLAFLSALVCQILQKSSLPCPFASYCASCSSSD